jgi:uncharacterized protein YegJ (DUF2314 family)
MKRFAVVALLIVIVVALAIPIVSSLGGFGRPSEVKRVAHANPELQTAARRAQAELDHFIEQLGHPKPGERFALKAGFDTEVGPEYLWVRDPAFENGVFTGVLDQAPLVYKEAKKGDKVTIRRQQVYDWLIKDGSTTQGGYTEQVLTRPGAGGQ